MKKILYSIASLALVFSAASCQQENLEPVAGSNTVTYTVQVPGAGATKALGDVISNVNELHYEVYRTDVKDDVTFTDADNLLYHKTAVVDNGVANITLELVNNQNFTVLFWAQVENNGVYTVTDLTNVTVATSADCNLETTQAFSGVDFIEKGESLAGRTVTLTRPISQLNIATTKASLKAFDDDVLLNGSSVTVKGLSQSFNVATQAAGEVTDAVYTYSKTEVPAVQFDDTYQYVAMNYVGFAPVIGANAEVTYKIYTSEGEIDNAIASVPMKPNYRTNIIGNLITSTSDYEVKLDAVWSTPAEVVEVWDGKFVSQPLVNEDGEYELSKASELAWFAAAVNGTLPSTVDLKSTTVNYATQTFVLTKDIDLGNYPWTPIGRDGDVDGFMGTFDGQGHTISNLNVDLTAKRAYQSAGLFGSITNAVIKNFTVKNASIKNLDSIGDTSNGSAVVVGASQDGAKIENVHVVNAVVSSNKRAAGIAGYFQGTIEKCTVDGLVATATPDKNTNGIFDNGDKVGGIVGYTNTSATITGCTVNNFSLKAYRDMGGLVGAGYTVGNYTNNTVNNGAMVVDQSVTPYNDAPKAPNANPIVGRVLSGTLPASNSSADVAIANAENATETNEAFENALANVADGGVVAVSGEIKTASLNAAGKNITIIGTSDNAIIDATRQPGVQAANTQGNITFKNLTIRFSSTNDHYHSGFDADNGILTFENCKFEGIATSDGEFVFNNCQFTNTNKGKYAAWVYNGKTVYNNCTFIGVDRAAKVFNENAYSNLTATYNNCTFKASTANKAAVEVDVTINTAVPTYVEINNPTIENMGLSDAYSVGNGICNLKTSGKGLGIVNLNGKSYSVANTAAQLQALAWAVKEEMGVTTVEVADGTYSDDITLTVAAAGKTATGNLVFKAAEGASPVIAGTVTLGYREQTVGAAMWNCAITFDGITFDHANATTHSLDVQDVKSLTLKNCTIIGDGEYGLGSPRGNATGPSLIDNCTFENAAMQILGSLGTGLVINKCTFNESRINVQGGDGVTVQNCNFTNTLTNANVGDSFYLIRSNSTPITVKECNINIDSELTDVAANEINWAILHNRGNKTWEVENVSITMSEAALDQTELFVTKCTLKNGNPSGGTINTTNLTVNGNVQ